MSQDIYRGTNSISLPTEVSSEILQKTQDESAIMHLATQISLPGNGLSIPMITGDPTAEWVAETDAKPVSFGTPSLKRMQAYKIAVIEPFSQEFTRDAKALYDAMVRRLPGALAKVFDNTIVGGTSAPGSYFDTFANCSAYSLITTSSATAYANLVDVDTAIATAGGILNGFALAPKAKGLLLKECDDNGRPLFINSVSEGAIPQILGAPTYVNKGLYVAGSASSSTPETIGVAGDWTMAKYGTVEGVKVSISDQATLSYTNASSQTVTINLWQQNMVAVRAEIEVGFIADTDCFVLLTGETPS